MTKEAREAISRAIEAVLILTWFIVIPMNIMPFISRIIKSNTWSLGVSLLIGFLGLCFIIGVSDGIVIIREIIKFIKKQRQKEKTRI